VSARSPINRQILMPSQA